MKMRRLTLLGMLLVLSVCALLAGAPLFKPVYSPADPVVTAAHLINKYDCTFCHVTGPRERHEIDDPQRNCALCHDQIDNSRYLAPNLDALGTKLRPEWMRKFLKHPTIVRHYLKDQMPDFKLSDFEVNLLVAHFEANRKTLPAAPDPAVFALQPERHLEIMTRAEQAASRDKHNCFMCHDFTGFSPLTDTLLQLDEKKNVNVGTKITDVRYFAPDFKYTRERMEPEVIYNCIMNPEAVDSKTRMAPLYEITAEDAEALTYMILHAELNPEARPGEPFYDRIHAEMEAGLITEVPADPNFQKDVLPLINRYCVSCHYRKPSEMMGWATGYKGGFGYPERNYYMTGRKGLFGLNRKNEKGEVEPVIVPGDLDSIFLKRIRGEIDPPMPLGQKISPEAIHVFENWIRNGAKLLQKDGKSPMDKFVIIIPGEEPDIETD